MKLGNDVTGYCIYDPFVNPEMIFSEKAYFESGILNKMPTYDRVAMNYIVTTNICAHLRAIFPALKKQMLEMIQKVMALLPQESLDDIIKTYDFDLIASKYNFKTDQLKAVLGEVLAFFNEKIAENVVSRSLYSASSAGFLPLPKVGKKDDPSSDFGFERGFLQ